MKTLLCSVLVMMPLMLNCCNLYNDFCDNMEDMNNEETVSIERFRRNTDQAAERRHNISREEMGRRVSRTLDILFGNGYNKQLRPGIGGGRPTIVEVNIAVRSVPLSHDVLPLVSNAAGQWVPSMRQKRFILWTATSDNTGLMSDLSTMEPI